MRDIPLTTIKGGINRTRTKGGARADSLYDLLNAYVTEDGTIVSRPGTFRVANLPSTTRGLVNFDGTLNVFSHQTELVPGGYTCHVLSHPDSTPELTYTLDTIHFAAPFLGFLYVVAEFSNADVYHFWLQSNGSWTADTIYRAGDIVEPTQPQGIAFRATRNGSAFPSWAARVPRTVGDNIEPTVYNDFYYTVVDTIGANPASGDTEPEFPEVEGAQITEDTEGVPAGSATTTQPGANTPTSGVSDRYGSGL
jgi:hypothetical protein